ncbi:MAG: VOC family protein [Solirubrobacteraceae bacterium]|jgi:predicted enzyme related to lactoylglutathione lyase
MDPVVHFELPAEDRERVAAFYAAAFGWETQMLGPEMGNYAVVTTTPVVNGRPAAPGTINGGFFLRTSDSASHTPSVVIAVQSIKASLQAVKEAGGTVTEPNEIPGVGTYASFFDTEGNRGGILQPLPSSAEFD